MCELNGRKLWRYYTKSETLLPEPPEPEEIIVTGGTVINIFEHDDKPCYSMGVGRASKVPSSVKWGKDIILFLHKCQEKVRTWTKSPTYRLRICTEHTRNSQIFRGHPQYRGDKHWRDWVMLDWGNDHPEPAQIWCFVDLNGIAASTDEDKLIHGNCTLDPGVYAVIECASARMPGNKEPKSRFFEPIVKEMRATGAGARRERKFYMVDTEAITDPCFVIPNIGAKDGKTYFRVKSREEWIHVFEDWLVEPYPEAYLNDKEGKNL